MMSSDVMCDVSVLNLSNSELLCTFPFRFSQDAYFARSIYARLPQGKMWAALLEKGIAKLLGSYKAANADVQISFGIELIRRSGFGASKCTAFVFSFWMFVSSFCLRTLSGFGWRCSANCFHNVDRPWRPALSRRSSLFWVSLEE